MVQSSFVLRVGKFPSAARLTVGVLQYLAFTRPVTVVDWEENAVCFSGLI